MIVSLDLWLVTLSPSLSRRSPYRKGDKQFHRDTLGSLANTFGLQAVSLVAVDDTWSALRFRLA